MVKESSDIETTIKFKLSADDYKKYKMAGYFSKIKYSYFEEGDVFTITVSNKDYQEHFSKSLKEISGEPSS